MANDAHQKASDQAAAKTADAQLNPDLPNKQATTEHQGERKADKVESVEKSDKVKNDDSLSEAEKAPDAATEDGPLNIGAVSVLEGSTEKKPADGFVYVEDGEGTKLPVEVGQDGENPVSASNPPKGAAVN